MQNYWGFWLAGAFPDVTSGAWPFIGLLGSQAISLPPFVSFMCRLALHQHGRPAVVVVPDKGALPALLTLLCAKERAGRLGSSPEEALSRLPSSVRVRVLPDEGIYQFDGIEHGGFWLRLLQSKKDKGTSRIWVPIQEAWRIEPTESQRPYGLPNRHQWPQMSTTPWDAFASSRICGNAALTKLAVVLVGSRSEIERATETFGFAQSAGRPVESVLGGLPLGVVDEDGEVHVTTPNGAIGEPVVAVARNHAVVRRLAMSKPRGSIVVVSTKTDDALSDRTSVEIISERQGYILVSSGRDREALSAHDRQTWTVLELSGCGVLHGGQTGIPMFDRNIQSAEWMKLSPRLIVSADEHLNSAYHALRAFSQTTARFVDEDEDVAEGAAILRQTFFDASDWLVPPKADSLSAFQESQETMARLRPRVASVCGKEAAAAAQQVVEGVRLFIERHASSTLTPKGDVIVGELSKKQHSSPPAKIVVGHRYAAQAVGSLLASLNLPAHVCTPAELQREGLSSTIHVLSMMRRESFARLVDPWPAEEVCFFGYQHEVDTYARRLEQRNSVVRALRVTESDAQHFGFLRDLVQVSTNAATSTHMLAEDLDVPQSAKKPKLLRPGEQVRSARFCRFVGRSWMPITDDHIIARVQHGPQGKLQVGSTTGRNLQVGDLLLIREGGDRDVLRELAEELAGPANYAKLRKFARVWRDELSSSGLGVDMIRERLAWQGVKRGAQAIRGWLSVDGPIGPNEPEVVIPAIAELLEQDAGLAKWKNCLNAIQAIWKLHLNAGFKLTQTLIRECGEAAVEHSEHEALLRLSLGEVWLVEVQQLEATKADWPYTQVNRLQWESDSWRRRLVQRAEHLNLDNLLDGLVSVSEEVSV